MIEGESKIFTTGHYRIIEKRIASHISDQQDWLSDQTVSSTRAVGDSLEGIVSESFDEIIGAEYCKSYSKDFARKAMADVAFEDHEGRYYVVDVKTHRLSTKFNMPNLISVERLSRFYESDKNFFIILMISYEIEDLKVFVEDVKFIPIEYLGWDCLTIGALGWGQIQISNSNHVTVNDGFDRASWMIEFCDTMLSFYPKEIRKLTKE